jgi:hypothetical protein
MTKEYPTKTLKSIRGQTVTITGKCWIGRDDLARMIRKQGGLIQPKNPVNNSTTVLVRGASQLWKYKTHGRKEAKAAQLIQSGQSLVVVPDYEFQKLMDTGKPARLADTVAGQPLEWLETPSKRVFDDITKISGALDREYTTKGRLEQGYLRAQLFKGTSSSRCAICGREFPTELLIAAHIKPRSQCTLKEKRDAANIVFPLCLFGCDSLYERGIISIDDQGDVKVGTTFKITKSLMKFLKEIKDKRCEYWTDTTAQYFQWHFERRFRQ